MRHFFRSAASENGGPTPATAYVVALLAVAVAVLLRWLVDPWIGNIAPLGLILGVAAVLVWYAGLGPALFGTILGLLLSVWLFFPPRGEMQLTGTVLLGTAPWALSVALVLLFGHLARLARLRLRRSRDDLERVNRELGFHLDELQALFESAPVGIWVTHDPTGRAITQNRTASGWFPYSDESGQVSYDHRVAYRAVSGGQELELSELPLYMAATKGVVSSREVVFSIGDRPPIAIHITAVPLFDDERRPHGAIAVGMDVTAHRQAEQSRDLLAAIVASSGDAIVSKDIDGVVTSWNAGAERLFGYAAAEMVGQSVMRLMPPERQDEERQALESIRRGERLEQMETERLRRDGRPVEVSLTISPLLDAAGQVAGSSTVARDISERRAAERRVRQAEERLRMVMDNIPALVSFVDRDGRYVLCNRAYEEWFGLHRDQIIGQPVGAVVGDETWAQIGPRMEVALRGEQLSFQDEIAHPGGGPRWVSVDYIPRHDEEGNVNGVIVLVTDLTRHHQAELALHETETKFRLLADNIAGFAWMAARDGSLTWINQRWFDYTGCTARETVGLGWLAQLRPDWAGRILEKYRKQVAAGETWEDTFPLPGRDGQERWFLARAVPLRDAGGQVAGWFGTATDVTAIREIEESLRTADRRKDQFLATLAHELRNPLAPISNALEVMERTADAEAAVNARRMIHRQVRNLTRLVDDLLDVSRISQGKLELRLERITLEQVISDLMGILRPFIDERRQSLSVLLPTQPVVLNADATRLEQVFGNLLGNASRYTPDGGAITLRAEVTGNEVEVLVEDTGIGIAPDDLDDIFGMFQQAGTAGRGRGGLGIGLTLVRQLVELHGGTVAARSPGVGQGATFVVCLPLAEALPAATGSAPARATGERPAERHRVLVVDDHRDSADSLAAMLGLMGQETITAYDGETALELAQRFRPELILLDIGLPGLSGYDVARRLRLEPWGAGIVIVAASGWGQDEDRRRSSEAGFDHHLVKPVDAATLEALIRDRIGHFAAYPEHVSQ